jgi:site-specific DNA recombinase
LFDEHGEPLTPSHAVKGTRRYRYYVSRNLIQDKAEQAHSGWRLPPAETEGIVAGAAVQILNDQKAILDAVQGAKIPTSRMPEIIQSASAWSHRLASAIELSSPQTDFTSSVADDAVCCEPFSESVNRLTLERRLTSGG